MGGGREQRAGWLSPHRLRTRFNLSPLGRRRSKQAHASTSSARSPSSSEMSVGSWLGSQDQAAEQCGEQPDQVCVDSFWNEVENIRQQSCSEPAGTRRDSRHSEEGDQEEQWLQDAGLSTLISEGQQEAGRQEVGQEVGQEAHSSILLSTLTRTQAATVQRRLDSYTLSLRKRNKPPPRDVRDVFDPPITQTSLPERQDSIEDSMDALTKTSLTAGIPEKQSGCATPREEMFITDVAYCEQAVLFLKQAKLQNTKTARREDGTLPRVTSPHSRLGVTRVQDLSLPDMKKVRQLALIDMTALCDLLGLDTKRHKTSKRKIPESPLFGVPLASLLEHDQKIKPTTTIPLILQALLSFLEKRGVDSEGILRVPGSQSRIKLLQQSLESSFYCRQVSWEEVSPNDAAALLKKFIRELPSPLLTAEHLNTFSAVKDIPDLKQKLHMLNLLILLLPEPNRNTLKALLEFLSKVVSREKRNRMNLWAVATIMAPNFFLHKAVPSRLTEGAEKGQAERAADIMRLLIRYQDLLWTIPCFLLTQVRRLNDSSRRYQFYDRRIKNLLKKISTDSRDKPDKNSSEPCRTVKVQLGEKLRSSMQVTVTVSCTASDLLAQFHHQFLSSADNSKGLLRRNGSVSYPDCAIYEVGGNIGEHCLDPDTHLLDLFNNNPGGEWVIKLKPGSSRGL
ncbi:rho GTPase-activating protein 40 isoform X2 [Osmerus eperlanus]|uniref:rho GTPase-activating protein 40 isoform X2 n=1 Tax=Osmerus eperlanus TaxID=29151 RepID=UPI002E13C0D1